MTRARRRVVRLAHMLKVASVEPVFMGCNYREMQESLEEQLAGLMPSRRKAVRRQALRLISEAQGLERAADHLVPRPFQQGSTGTEPQTQSSLTQMLHRPPETPHCSVCRMRLGPRKRSFPSQAAAQQMCDRQRDPGLVVYACQAGEGWHLGHRHGTTSATSNHPATAQRREPHRVNEHAAPMLPNPLHKESPMKMQVTLGHPILIAIYSAALLFIGCGVGVHWNHTLPTAFWLCIAGSIFMAAHDLALGFVWFWLTACWARSVMIQRDNRR
jgi:hypothetical protein